MDAHQKNVTLEGVLESARNESDEEKSFSKRIQLVVFKLGDEEYAFSLDEIKEVVITPNIAKVPQTPDFIKGVANIRGNVIAIMDLETKFNIAKHAEKAHGDTANYTLVVEHKNLNVGILVNDVPNTLTILESDIDSAASIVYESNFDENSIKGIVKKDNKMIILLDLENLVSRDVMGRVNDAITR